MSVVRSHLHWSAIRADTGIEDAFFERRSSAGRPSEVKGGERFEMQGRRI